MERWWLLAVLSLGWGSAYLFQDEAVAEISPLTLTGIRLAAAAALLYAVLRIRGETLPRTARPWMFFLAIGLIGNLLPFVLITWAQTSVKSSVAGILTAIVPIVTLTLAHWVGDEPLTIRRVAGFALGFAGVAVLFGPQAVEEASFGLNQLLPYAALLAAAVCFGVAAVISARMPPTSPMAGAAGVLIAGAALTAPLALVFGTPTSTRLTLDAIGSAAVLALLITPWATYAYFRLVRLSGPAFLSLFNYFNPLIAVAAGVLVLGERLPPTAIWAMVLILGGVAVSEFRRLVKAAESAIAG